MPDYVPLFTNPHLATIAARYWPRTLDTRRYPVEAKLFGTEPGVRVLVHIQRPAGIPFGEVILLHGLEGSSDAGYMRSLAQALLDAGFAVHRMNIRTCGGTGFLCQTLYHAGLTSDLFTYLMDLDRQRRTPVHLVGFSLGGNMVLKLLGELGTDARRLVEGAVTVSTPLDLGACSRRLKRLRNVIYDKYFLITMHKHLKLRREVIGKTIPAATYRKAPTLYAFDDQVTAPAFGFRDAEHYYSTQSAKNFLAGIRVPTLLIQAKDDPMIPAEVYQNPALTANGFLRLVMPDHGGHLGFLAKGRGSRFWVDEMICEWVSQAGEDSHAATG